VFDGRAAVRSELEGIFSGKEWPALATLVEPFRRYAVAVFDVYASAYSHVARTLAAYQEALDELLLPMVLRDLFGREWDHAPGETVVRTLWQGGRDGKPEGREVKTVAGNDPDAACVFYDLLSNAIEHRHRFFEPLPAPEPGDLPGINLMNLEWWRYIGLSERHSLAMAIKPYIEDRVSHWRFIYAPTAPADSDSTSETTKSDASRQQEPSSFATRTDSMQDSSTTADVKSERRALHQAYKAECSKQGVRVTDAMIAEAASSNWHGRTAIQKWLADDPRYAGEPDRLIRSVLARKPHIPSKP